MTNEQVVAQVEELFKQLVSNVNEQQVQINDLYSDWEATKKVFIDSGMPKSCAKLSDCKGHSAGYCYPGVCVDFEPKRP